jgi:hypothetical protein
MIVSDGFLQSIDERYELKVTLEDAKFYCCLMLGK